MKEFGFHQPVVVDEEGTILVGHARTLAALSLGLKSIPCVRATGMSEVQKRALIIADNRLHEFGAGWDDDLLSDELRMLMAKGIDVSLTEPFRCPSPSRSRGPTTRTPPRLRRRPRSPGSATSGRWAGIGWWWATLVIPLLSPLPSGGKGKGFQGLQGLQ